MKPLLLMTALLALMVGPVAWSQEIQVNRENKTIAVTTDDELVVDAELAILTVGYSNYAATSQAAFDENVSISNKISQALLDAGVPASEIETETLRVSNVEPDSAWTDEQKRLRKFEARQSWEIRVPVSRAQETVDVAIRAGATSVGDVEWTVADPAALQARASGAALAKARRVAEQMANGLDAKLGDLVYASNRAPVPKFWRGLVSTESSMVTSVGRREAPRPALKLFPQKVRSQATVHAVFSIQ